jgi:hypothetical protein
VKITQRMNTRIIDFYAYVCYSDNVPEQNKNAQTKRRGNGSIIQPIGAVTGYF